MNQQHDKSMNEQIGIPLHKNEIINNNDELRFELLSIRQQLNRILTAAKCNSVEEVVQMLTKQTPTDEELNKMASDMFDAGDIDNTTSFKIGYKSALTTDANRWVSVVDRLPNEEGEYLTYNVHFDSYEICSYSNKYWTSFTGDDINIDYWQPLPPNPSK
jgi:regulator of replication initiation timing